MVLKVCQLSLVIIWGVMHLTEMKNSETSSLVYPYLSDFMSSRKSTILRTFHQCFVFQESELIKGAGKMAYSSSTVCLLSCNIHSLALVLRWYASSYIFWFSGHSVLFQLSASACDIEAKLYACIYSCQAFTSLFLWLTYTIQQGKQKSALDLNCTFVLKMVCDIPYLLSPNPCILCHMISYYMVMVKCA